MLESSKTKPAFKAWLETEEGYVFGPGVYRLLKKVRETGTLKDAAESIGMSYRFAWGLVKKAEQKIGRPLIHAHKGGRAGGGGAEITELGLQFLEEYSKIEHLIERMSRDPGFLERLSSFVQVDAEVTQKRTKGERAELTFKVKEPSKIKVTLSSEQIEGLDIAVGDKVTLELSLIVEDLKKTKS